VEASPLAACSVESSSPSKLIIFLYYMDVNQNLNRVVGEATGQVISWHRSRVVSAPTLKATTLMAATNAGKQNYVYYIPDGQNTFSPFIDPITDEMFRDD
jgi:hypothetical protein